MEDPATRTEAEKIIDEALTAGHRAALGGQVGWSLARQIAEALRERGYLRSDEEAAHEFYSDPEHLKVAGPGRQGRACRVEGKVTRHFHSPTDICPQGLG